MTHTSLFFAAAPLPLLQFMCNPSPHFALSWHHHRFLLLRLWREDLTDTK